MTHPIEQAADAVERELADLRAKFAGAMQHVMDYSNDPHLVHYARAVLAQIKGDE